MHLQQKIDLEKDPSINIMDMIPETGQFAGLCTVQYMTWYHYIYDIAAPEDRSDFLLRESKAHVLRLGGKGRRATRHIM